MAEPSIAINLDPAKLKQILAQKPRWHTFQGNGGCEIDAERLIGYVSKRPATVQVMPEMSMAYRLDHEVGVVDDYGYLIGIDLTADAVVA